MIKAKFILFQMQQKGMLRHAGKQVESTFGKNSERLDTVDMGRPLHKLVVAVEHPVVPVKTHIHQAIVVAPAIGVDHCDRVNFTLNNTLQGLFRTVRHYFRVHLAAAFEQVEDNRFAARFPASFVTHPARAEVRLVEFERATQLDWHGA